MDFEPGQDVVYERTRSGLRATEHIPGVYVAEVQFSHKERRHKIIITLRGQQVFRFVGLEALQLK